MLVLFLVVIATACLTGGIGMRVMGSSTYGGRSYLFILCAVAGYFGLSSVAVPPERARLYLGLFLLPGLTYLLANLAYSLGPAAWWMLRLLPAEYAMEQMGMDASLGPNFARISSLSPASLFLYAWLLGNHGISGLMNWRRPLRPLLFLLAWWPRVIEKNGNELTIYQPQVDFWTDYAKRGFRCAIAVKTVGAKEEKFGIAEIEAETVTDHENRTVVVIPKKRELRFPNIAEAEANTLRGIVNELHPPVQAMTVSLDRILTYLEPEKQPVQQAVELNLDPPKIFYSAKPALLVIFMGEPQLQPVVKDKNDLMFAVNTNWDVFYDAAGQRYHQPPELGTRPSPLTP